MATSPRTTVPPKPGCRIHGRVLVKESHAGIPDLVVAFFDLNLRASVRSKPVELSANAEQLGTRLGSVLTDRTGSFEFLFDADPNPPRTGVPDIVIVVSAPEDTDNADTQAPQSAPPPVLHMSRAPRMDVGRHEAYVVRISQDRLDRFGIPGRRSLSSLETPLKRRERLREQLKPRLAKEAARAKRLREMAGAHVKNLSGIPLHRRDADVFNADLLITDKAQLAEKLKSLQAKTIIDGLNAMSGENRRRPTLRLRLTREDLAALKLTEEKGRVTGTVTSEQLTQKMMSLVGDVDLIKKRGLNNPSPEALERRYLVTPARLGTSGNDPGNGDNE